MKYLFFICLLSGCVAQSDSLTLSTIKLRCMSEMLALPPELISKEAGDGCNRSKECVRHYLDKWEAACIKRHSSS